MTAYTFKLPDIGEGIAEAEIVAWHVQPGDMIEEDEPLCDVMTDKATVEMSAPVSGKVLQTSGKVGDRIAIGSVLAVFQTEGAAGDQDAAVPCAVDYVHDGAPAPSPPEPPAPSLAIGPVRAAPVRAEIEPISAAPSNPGREERVLASPTIRQRAKLLGIDLAQVKTAGDRVRHADLDAFLTYNRAYRAPSARSADVEVPVVGLRRRIAENMAASKRAIPHFTYIEEIEVTKLEELRADLNATRGNKPKLTVLPLLIAAICKTVSGFPMINARYDDEAGVVTRSGAVHLGIATQTDAGLMVPVIRDAQGRNIWQLAGEIARLADLARTGRAAREELSGSTLTITSLGPLGGIATTPVINRPEVAIIGPNRIVERPVFRNGAVAAAKLMNLSISCDHRVVDGWDAASFVQALKRVLETPALLFADQ